MSLHYYLTIPHLDRPSSKLARYSTYSTNTSERENKTSFERWQWVLPRPKAAFLQELCFEDTVRLRPPQKKNNLINDIDIFCCMLKKSKRGHLILVQISAGEAASGPCKEQALLFCWGPVDVSPIMYIFRLYFCSLHFVFLCRCNFAFAKMQVCWLLLILFFYSYFGIAKIQMQ